MTRKITDRDRVLTALRAGPVNSTAFSYPHVYDSGKAISRVAARILDLKAAGYEISKRTEKNHTATYTLVRDVVLSDDGNTDDATADAGASTTVAQNGAPTADRSGSVPPLTEPTPPPDTLSPSGGGNLFDVDRYVTRPHYDQEVAA